MKPIFLAITILICCATNAQQLTLNDLKSNMLAYRFLDKNTNQMPIAKVGPNNQNYLFNNSVGLDIYKSQPDNMPVAKPDDSYVDNMVAKQMAPKTMTDVINKLKNNRFQPKGNAKYNFVMPAYKDSLPYINSANKLLLKPTF